MFSPRRTIYIYIYCNTPVSHGVGGLLGTELDILMGGGQIILFFFFFFFFLSWG
jgi:hypothetical protein